MKKIILVPDSFKGTLSAAKVCDIEKKVILKHIPEAEIHCIPMADGGEGMVEAYLSIMGGEKQKVMVSGPLGDQVMATYGILPDGSGVMEMAQCAGLPLVTGRENPMKTTTYGVGEMIQHAINSGVSKILLGLGGSCTNDCGIGMAAALGFQFADANGNPVEPIPANLINIQKIFPPKERLNAEIYAACDVDNPLTGERGATYTFAPQKGADPIMLKELEAGMVHFEKVLKEYSGIVASDLPGSGAAGGMGAAVSLLLNGKLLPGAELLLDCANFNKLLEGTDLVITGEGRMDWQSAHGKVPGTVAKRCRQANVPCIALCGSLGMGAEKLYEIGITSMFGAVKGITTLEEVQKSCAGDLEFLTDGVMRMLKIRDI